MVNAEDVVIWSADVDEETLFSSLDREDLGLRYAKLDRAGLTRMGLSSIASVQDMGYKVFADAKIVEVPHKVVEVAQLHLDHHPWMLNTMADVWSTGLMEDLDPNKIDGLKRFADACHAAGTLPCAVSVLTSKTPEVVAKQYNGRTVHEQVGVYASVLVEAGFTDLVCSPQEVGFLRAFPDWDSLTLNTPGIREAKSDQGDQARTDTPSGAIKNGSDRLVIGTNLTEGDLVDNFNRIAAELATVK